MWIISINVKYPITSQGALYLLQFHQNQHVKYKVNIVIFLRKSYQRTYLEDIWFICDQVRTVVSHLEAKLPEKHLTPKNVGEAIKGHQRNFCKEALFLKYDKNKNFSLLLSPIPIKALPDITKVLHSLIATSINEGNCCDVLKKIHSTVQIGVL